MGFFRKTVGFLGYNAHREIFNKTLGRSIKDGRIKATLSEAFQKLLWACMVIGDRCFPILKDRRLFGTLHISGLIVLIIASLIPAFLIFRAGRKLTDFDWVTEQRRSRKARIVSDTNHANPYQGETIHGTGNTIPKEGQAKEGGQPAPDTVNGGSKEQAVNKSPL